MGYKHKDDCYNSAMDDEPMFVILARDKNAPEIVEKWAMARDEAIRKGQQPTSDWKKVEEALRLSVQMRAWREKNKYKWQDQRSERFIHKKRQTEYQRLTARCELQTTIRPFISEGTVLSIYVGADGSWYARPTEEFNDGRFIAK